MRRKSKFVEESEPQDDTLPAALARSIALAIIRKKIDWQKTQFITRTSDRYGKSPNQANQNAKNVSTP